MTRSETPAKVETWKWYTLDLNIYISAIFSKQIQIENYYCRIIIKFTMFNYKNENIINILLFHTHASFIWKFWRFIFLWNCKSICKKGIEVEVDFYFHSQNSWKLRRFFGNHIQKTMLNNKYRKCNSRICAFIQ